MAKKAPKKKEPTVEPKVEPKKEDVSPLGPQDREDTEPGVSQPDAEVAEEVAADLHQNQNPQEEPAAEPEEEGEPQQPSLEAGAHLSFG